MRHVAYILRCADGTLYAGSTADMEKRLHAHNHLKSGARYTKARRPVSLVYCEPCASLAAARAREAALKRLSRAQKLRLIRESRRTRRVETDRS